MYIFVQGVAHLNEEAMARNKRVKGYWEKRKECYVSGAEARSRAETVRANEHVQHVGTTREANEYVVTFSVARWYLDELEKAGVKL